MLKQGFPKAALLAILGAALVTPAAMGQLYGKPKKRTKPDKELEQFKDEAEKVLAPITDGSGQTESDAAQYWSIVLVAFTGDKQSELASLGLIKARTEGGLPDAYAEKRDRATVIAYGRYASADDPQAQADLAKIRTLKVNGETPFATALLTPPAPQHLAGSLPDLDLRNTKRIFGKNKALYTLQVAIYGRADRSPASKEEIAEYRKAAEEAAVILRRDGELAFYYHAPERSMVTVGVFNEDDYDPINRPGIEGYGLMQAREKHPLNLLNGQGIREKIIGAQGDGPETHRMQPSTLVAVPES